MQWFPVESMSTEHMMSQLTKTIKMALKSTEEERAMLRARSAVQRFPVVEWRQRMEDFHKRSIGISRGVAGSNAWRTSDCDGGGGRPIEEHDDWNPEFQAYPSQPAWDSRSINEDRNSTINSPGQWSQGSLTPNGELAPPRLNTPDDRRGSISTDVSDNEGDYFTTPNRASGAAPNPAYGHFLEKANRQIARDQKHAPDPFLDAAAPSRPFGAHSRVSSVESIASIVTEKQDSPLNKAIASVRAYTVLRVVLYTHFSTFTVH